MAQRFFVMCLLGLLLIPGLHAQASWTQEFPGIGTFSSPVASDLNHDGTMDLILGAGRAEFMACDSGVLALDGTNGEILWKVSAQDQMFGTARLKDLDGDGIEDVLIGGRSAELKAIHGSSGEILWTYYQAKKGQIPADLGLYNFYNPQFIPDQDQDGLEDILVANGGDVRVEAYNPNRPAGSLMILSSKTGKLLSQAAMPDGKEIYMSVITREMTEGLDSWVVFGTGGETIGGSLYVCKLSDIRKQDLSTAKQLATSEGKGFISPPVWADVNKDGIHDIIAMSVAGSVYAFDGKTFARIWEQQMPNTEAYSSFAVGNFTGDEVPDFFVSVAKGEWPHLEWNHQFMLNGLQGQIEFVDSLGFYQTSTAVAADLSQNGRDEVMLSVNYQIRDSIERKTFKNMLVAVDFKAKQVIQLGAYFDGNNISSTPWIGDLDGNQKLDIVYVHATNRYKTYTFDGMKIHRIDTDIPANKPILWGAYMGSAGDAMYPLLNQKP